MADEYVSRASVLRSIHNGDIDMGMVTIHEYYLLKDLSERIDRRIQRVPTADVVPVVRCKDCKYNLANIPDIQDGININENWDACQLTELYDSVEPLDFCSRGAKMDGGGQDG